MPEEKWNEVDILKFITCFPPDRKLVAEDEDAKWADFGRQIDERLHHVKLCRVLNRAMLRANGIGQATELIRQFLLTGKEP